MCREPGAETNICVFSITSQPLIIGYWYRHFTSSSEVEKAYLPLLFLIYNCLNISSTFIETHIRWQHHFHLNHQTQLRKLKRRKSIVFTPIFALSIVLSSLLMFQDSFSVFFLLRKLPLPIPLWYVSWWHSPSFPSFEKCLDIPFIPGRYFPWI